MASRAAKPVPEEEKSEHLLGKEEGTPLPSNLMRESMVLLRPSRGKKKEGENKRKKTRIGEKGKASSRRKGFRPLNEKRILPAKHSGRGRPT